MNATNHSLQMGGSNTDTFTYQVTDGTDTDTAVLTITITGVNDAPEAVSPLPEFRDAVTGMAYSEPLTGLFTDADANDTMTFTLGTCGGFTISGNNLVGSGTGGIVPAATTAGEKSCVVTVTDSQEATETATISVTVTETNVAPSAVDDAVTGTEDQAVVTSNVINGAGPLMTGQDTDANTNAMLEVMSFSAGSTLASAPQTAMASNTPAVNSATANGGTLSINTNGAYTFTVGARHQSLQLGSMNTEVFSYRITDGALTDDATLTITITGRNDAPEAVSPLPEIRDAATGMAYSQPLTGLFTDVDANDTMTFTLGTCDGAFVVNGNNLVGSGTGGIVPTATTAGEKSCVVTVTDSQGATETATISVTVTLSDVAPSAADDTAVGSEDAGMLTGNVIDGAGAGMAGQDTDRNPGTMLEVMSFSVGSTLASAPQTAMASNTPGVNSATANGGTLSINTDGAYTFTVGTRHQSLAPGGMNTEVFSLSRHGRRAHRRCHIDDHHHRRQ